MNGQKCVLGTIVAFIIILALVLPGPAMIINNEKPTTETNTLTVIKSNHIGQRIEVPISYMDTSFKPVPQTLDANPAFDGLGDQLHPAFGRTTSGTHMAAYRDDDLERIIWTFSDDDGLTYNPNGYYIEGFIGDYPSIKQWEGTRFFGTFVCDPSVQNGGVIFMFESTDPTDNETYDMWGYDMSGWGFYDMIDADIACDSSQNEWEWGISSYVMSSYCCPSRAILTYAYDPTTIVVRCWDAFNCFHTDVDIDHENITGYIIWDQDEFLTNDWRLLCRVEDFEDIHNGDFLLYEITGAGNLQYPAVAVDNDNLVILAETDENGNRDIICIYSDDGINNLQTSFVADSIDDEMYPDVRHVENLTFVCTFVKNETLYTSETIDGGATWSIPVKVAENVVEEYKTADICELAAKGMWEVDNGIDIDIHVGDLEEFSDTQPPTTTHEFSGILGENNWYTSDVIITLEATDDLSGVNSTMYRIDSDTWEEYSSPVIVSDDGEHTLEYYSVDNAENIEEIKGPFDFKIDQTPPMTTCELDGTMEGGVYITDVTVTLTATDDLSDVNYTMYSVNNMGEWYQYMNPFVISEDGNHIIWFYSVDLAGNTENPKSESFTIQHPCPIEIEISGGLGVNAVITNIGEDDITDLEWSITITGGLLGLIDKEVNGIITILASGDSATIKSGLFFGLGPIVVTVTAECDEGSSDTENANGWQIIVFTLIDQVDA